MARSQNRGKVFEDIIEELYTQISKNERIKAKVDKRVSVLGNDDTTHEIDILYSYEHFGTQYQVAIECKSWNKPINVEELRNFDAKLKAIGNINGIFISQDSEFQRGAKKVASYNGITLIKYGEFNKFIYGQNEAYLEPDFNTIGGPFWGFMNTEGKNSSEQNLFENEGVLLFESRYFAEKFQTKYSSIIKEKYKLVGISQNHLKEIKLLKVKKNVPVKMFNQFTTENWEAKFHFWDLDGEDIDVYLR